MATLNQDPGAQANEQLGDEHGGNTAQPDDGRGEDGRLPEPLDAANYGVDVNVAPSAEAGQLLPPDQTHEPPRKATRPKAGGK